MIPLLCAFPLLEARILWVDAGANLSWMIDPEKVRQFCEQAKKAHFNEIVVDVKPINGRILFHAPGEPRLTEFRGVQVPEDYDVLKTFLQEARAAGLRLSAGLNTFSEGHSHFPGTGLAYEKPDWQSRFAVPQAFARLQNGDLIPIAIKGEPTPGTLVISEGEGDVKTPDGVPLKAHPSDFSRIQNYPIVRVECRVVLLPQTQAVPTAIAVFVDPLHPGVQERMLNLLRTVASYGVDGIVLDRMRFPAWEGGMGPAMASAFTERYAPVGSFPESVFQATWSPHPPYLRLVPGARYRDWMRFRAEVITQFLKRATEVIKEVNPRIALGVYVGGGWETYYEVGVNYSEDKPLPPYDWADEEYGLAGYAGWTDFLLPGCFYPVPREIDVTIQGERTRFTVEGAAKLMVSLAGGATRVYPTLYGLDWEGNPEGLRWAIRSAREIGLGVAFFDASYIIKNNWWSLFQEEFAEPNALPPHAFPSYPRKTVKIPPRQ
ncbi:MAG: family 10 glycosylhydrolase [Fimbriimonadales bacterium]|nr:family 10 glycosylhydrolase [Fimbriimonadales bacterium]